MFTKNFTFLHLVALVVANLGCLVWIFIPSLYFRAMWGSGNRSTMIEFFEKLWLMPSFLYDNKIADAIPFLHQRVDMSEVFITALVLGYIGNLAHAFYHLDMKDSIPFHVNLLLPTVPGLSYIILPYVAFMYLLLGILQVMSIPVALTSIFAMGDGMHAVTLMAYLVSFGLMLLAFKTA